MSLHNYDPSRVTLSFLGIDISDFQNATFIDVERNEDAFKTHTGSLGDKTVTRILDRGGKVTITLMAHGNSNDFLSLILKDAEQFGLVSGLTVGSLQIKDLGGATRVHAEAAWIVKQPKIERAMDGNTSTVWVIECADIEMFSGGNVGP